MGAQEIVDGLRVDEVRGFEPGTAQLDDAVIDKIELLDGVGIGVDDELAAKLPGAAEVEVGQIGAGRGRVVLDGYAKRRGLGK